MWQPIETAPRDGTSVVVAFANGSAFVSRYYSSETFEFGKSARKSEGWTNPYPSFGKDPEPVFWMSLPPLPRAQTEEA